MGNKFHTNPKGPPFPKKFVQRFTANVLLVDFADCAGVINPTVVP